MRDARSIRERGVSLLGHQLDRPSMYGRGREYETTVRQRLLDLAFIDERDDDLAAAFDELERRGG